MPTQEVLVLAVTHMLGGVCTAGMTAEPDAVTGLRWIRPVRERTAVLLGDLTTTENRVVAPFDVVQFQLLRPCPAPPHCEDWIVDFRYSPRVIRSLEGQRRATFLERHLDSAPEQVLVQRMRSLCLVKPDWVEACFRLDSYSGKYEARLAFGLGAAGASGPCGSRGASVTDLRWRALGRTLLLPDGGFVQHGGDELKARLNVSELYLAVGLTRPYQGEHWPIVIGVHCVPDYAVEVDYDNP